MRHALGVAGLAGQSQQLPLQHRFSGRRLALDRRRHLAQVQVQRGSAVTVGDFDEVGLVADESTGDRARLTGRGSPAVVAPPVGVHQRHRAAARRQHLRALREVEVPGETHRVVVVRAAPADTPTHVLGQVVPLHHANARFPRPTATCTPTQQTAPTSRQRQRRRG